MQSFELTVLGCSSATPTSTRNPSSQLLNLASRYFLIDCGEGTQIQLRKFSIKFQRIEHIFISHLHGDHYLGLPGLLASMHLLGRTKDLHLYAPPELKEILDIQNKHSQTFLNYQVIFHPLRFDESEIIFEDEKICVETILLNHRIPCCGFLFKEKRQARSINVKAIEMYQVPTHLLNGIKAGKDFERENGTTIPNAELTVGPPAPRAFAYCSDTCYDESLIPKVEKVDLLYHEATFMQNMADRAKETHHSTAIDAATIANKARVKQLLIGHYSARYKNLDGLLEEAKTVFENTLLAQEGICYKIGC